MGIIEMVSLFLYDILRACLAIYKVPFRRATVSAVKMTLSPF